DAQLRAQTGVAGEERTYTCAPPGSGSRMGIDRDEDGFLDRDEIDAGSDPADPASIPGGGTTTTSTTSSSTTTVFTTTTTTTSIVPLVLIETKSLTMRDQTTPSDPTRRRIIFRSATRTDALANRIVPPTPGGPGDPINGGGFVEVYNSAGQTTDRVNVNLPAAGWSALGTKGFKFTGNSATGPGWKVIIKPDLLVVKGGKAGWSYTLNEASQGSVGVRVVLGAGSGWCAKALPKSPPSVNDTVDKFIASHVPPPASCPPVGSPSGAFID